ncbi:putative lipoprotein [Escherichia coli]|uniref:Putative lipoprotein n=1 Tax=Escherichia coli TaxID=562 RepID=A0A2X1N5I6_ECOLX|nr:putative lipoprotein [Escherichia coli]
MINGGVPELKKQLDLNDAVPEISGTILFREDYLNKPQTQQAVSYLQSRWGSLNSHSYFVTSRCFIHRLVTLLNYPTNNHAYLSQINHT